MHISCGGSRRNNAATTIATNMHNNNDNSHHRGTNKKQRHDTSTSWLVLTVVVGLVVGLLKGTQSRATRGSIDVVTPLVIGGGFRSGSGLTKQMVIMQPVITHLGNHRLYAADTLVRL